MEEVSTVLSMILDEICKSSKLSKKQIEVDKLFKPGHDGKSRWVSRGEISENSILDWGKNGIARHGIYFGDKRYLWEKEGKNAITALRTVGRSYSEFYGKLRPIRTDIKRYHKSTGCVVCGSHSDLVIDHKNDLYNDLRVLNTSTQTIEDFQCLCNHCNLQKKQISKVTRKTMRRFAATKIQSLAIFDIDFIEGDESLDISNVNAMVGTYWYDPVEFMKQINKKLRNTK